ncbi:MAG: Integrator complex subunit 7, partial [Paramarteilia canceri]
LSGSTNRIGFIKNTQVFINECVQDLIINNAYLKLADVFLSGNNVERFFIVSVFQETKSKLKCISSGQELVDRFLNVAYSTDSSALGLVFDLFTILAEYICNDKRIHHIILKALVQPVSEELVHVIKTAKSLSMKSV